MAVGERPFPCIQGTHCYNFSPLLGRVAQLVRAFGSHPRGRWFESNRAHNRTTEKDPGGSFFYITPHSWSRLKLVFGRHEALQRARPARQKEPRCVDFPNYPESPG